MSSPVNKILMSIFKNSKKAEIMEKILNKTYSSSELANIAYNIYGEFLSGVSPQKIEQDIVKNTLTWNSECWAELKQEQADLDDFITNPLQVEEGVETCKKCGSKRTFSKQLQVRSSDEGFTTFCACAQCGTRWRIN